MAEPVKDNYLRTSEINILKEKLCVGLKPNAEPPQDRDELLRELIRLEHHFADVEKIQKDCFTAYNKLKDSSEGQMESVDKFCTFIVILVAGIVAWLFDNIVVYILMVIWDLYFLFTPSYHESAKRLDESAKRRFSNLYKTAERNFIKSEDVFFLPKMRSMVETGEASDYASLMICLEKYLKLMNDYLVFNLNYINAMRDIESGRFRFRQRSVNTYDRWGFRNGGLYGKCRCGAYFDASGVCPNCGKSNRM